MSGLLRSDRAIDAVILVAIAVDVVLVVRTGLDPAWWFDWLHGHRQPTSNELAFLYRCAAHWAAFALFQGLALARWRAWHGWLLVLAGVRFSDVFTDWTYLASADSVSAVGAGGLAAPGFLNWGMALFLVWAWTVRNDSHGAADRGIE